MPSACAPADHQCFADPGSAMPRCMEASVEADSHYKAHAPPGHSTVFGRGSLIVLKPDAPTTTPLRPVLAAIPACASNKGAVPSMRIRSDTK
jgi:hypothetical protein